MHGSSLFRAYYWSIVAFCVFFVLAFSCSSAKKPEGDSVPTPTASKEYLSGDNIGELLVVSGLFEVLADKTCIIIENPDSRGRVSFVLHLMPHMRLEHLRGKTVRAEGILTGVLSPWNKTLQLLQIEELSSK
ncbi:MAG: hypothetical protein Ta2A_27080 [Treponemataceae bacterium]|nr:MAG: hypothetical protein Ta2A_27080 [Treponemataceae bacterium]